MLNLVEEMGRYVDQKWQDMQRDERAFSELACNALGRFVGATSPRMSANDITQALTAATDISHRDHNSRFGQPAIRLYSGRGFYIEALFWLDASTAIHQHAFSGAFQVIEGGSVHAVYEFEQQERINSHLLVGKLNLCKAEVLRPGDTRPISDGSSFIHALFHLERPSVTLVLRTLQNPDALPQYNYYRPGFAQDPAPYDHLARTQVELLESLGDLGHPEYTRTVCELIRKRDVSLALSVLFDLARREFVSSADRQAIADELGRSFGPLATFLTQAERERSRELKILQLRARIHDPDLRFFLGLVLNVPNAKLIRQLVNERRPAALPVDTLVDWLLRIATKVKGAESVEAETAAGDRDQAIDVRILRHILDGSDIETTQVRLAEELGSEFVSDNSGLLRHIYEDLSGSSLIAPLRE